MSTNERATAAVWFQNEPDLDVKFPPLPKTIAEVSALLAAEAEVPDTPRLVEIVNVDPIVATSVLRRVNSAFYGVRRRVGNLRQAVFLLGFEEVCNLVLTASMQRLQDVLRSEEQKHIFDRLIETSMGTAYYANLLAEHLALPMQNVAFAAGLLHNVGRFVFLYNVPGAYEALWFTSEGGRPPRLHDERRIFGIDHGELGALAGQGWNLPEEIIQVIRFYSTPRLTEQAYLHSFVYAVAVAAAAGHQLDAYDETCEERWRFVPPTTLGALEREAGIEPPVLVDLVEAHYNEALDYVHAMAQA